MQLFQIMRQGSVILVGVLLAKSILSQGTIGQYEMLLFLGYTLTFFWINSLLQGLLPLYPELNSEDRKVLFFNSYLLFTGLSTLLLLVLFWGDNFWPYYLVGEPSLPHFHLFAIYLWLNLPTYLVEYFYLLQKKPLGIVSFGLFAFGGHLLVVLLPVFLGYGLRWSFYGLIALALAKHLWTLIFLSQSARVAWQPKLWKNHLTITFPLMLFTILSGLTTIFDNWLVGWFYEEEAAFAIFRFGAKELPLVTALAGAFSASLIPEIATDLPQALQMIRQKSLKLFHLLFPISALLLLTSYWWFPLVFNESFAESAKVFNLYLLVLISRMVFTHTILIGLKRTDIVLYISVMEVSLNIVLSLWFVRIWGMEGIALATVIAFSLEKIATMLYLYFRRGIAPRQYLNSSYLLGYSLLLLGSYAFVQLYHG